MIAISEVIQHLTQFEANRSIAQNTFVNFLRYATEPNEVFSASTVDFFYRKTLSFSYWQTHQDSLGDYLRMALKPFGSALGFDASIIPHAEDYQVVPVRKSDEFFEIVRLHDRLTQNPSLKIQYIQLSKRQILRLEMNPRGELCAIVIPQIVFLQGGRLQPLTESSRLQYSTGLEISSGDEQWLELGEGRFARYFLRQGKVYGTILRGHMFQQEAVLAGPLSKYIDICVGMKALERYFIDPQSDPMYQQVMTFLENASVQKMDSPHSLTEGEIALKESKEVIQLFFPHDKLLQHLVYRLESQLRNAKGLTPWPTQPHLSASTNTSQKLGLPADAEPTNSFAPVKF